MPVKIKNFAFRKYVGPVAPNGARTVGFADLTLVLDPVEIEPVLNPGIRITAAAFKEAQRSGSQTVSIELRDIKCRVNARGEHTLCAPSRRYTNAKGETRTRSAFKFDESTYGALRDAIFASKDVVSALGERAPSAAELAFAQLTA